MADDQPVIRCWHCVNAADIKAMHQAEEKLVPARMYRRAIAHLNSHTTMTTRRVQ